MLPQGTGTSGTARIDNLRQRLKLRRGRAFLITSLINIRYLTGFSGSSGYLLITGEGCYFFTDFRYQEQSKAEVVSCEIIITKKDPVGYIIKSIEKKGIKHLACEDTLSYRQFAMFSKKFQMTALKDTIEKIRLIKDEAELWHIRRAAKRAEDAFIGIKPQIKAGVTEKAVASMLEESLTAQGVSNMPFKVIAASGRHAAMPHAKPTDKALEGGDLLILDWGGESDGYYSDMTRTFLIAGGNDLSKKREIYDIVRNANREARNSVRTGQSAAEVDMAARRVIADAGYGQYFGHSTGHGVGIEVHELPYISAVNRKQKLEQNMVFTIEPGIYIPALGGVRIEDMVCVTGDSPQMITNLSRNLEII
ncbi:MAG: Xaa-Pro peptidase family protein [Candidatus Magnetominusculus sp. LBB02]|nr:Xaa-Pro peptidase family protein [Candidatus Magnetominusculus sp. LBB02]